MGTRHLEGAWGDIQLLTDKIPGETEPSVDAEYPAVATMLCSVSLIISVRHKDVTSLNKLWHLKTI